MYEEEYDVLRDNIGLLNESKKHNKVAKHFKDDNDDMNGSNDKPAFYNPLYLMGRGIGYLTKRVDQGFSKSYGGAKHAYQIGYGRDKLYTNPHIEHESGDQSGISLGVGLGKAYDDGNRLYNIPINQYQDSDGSFINDGDDPATYRTNIPAIIAARMAGGSPDPKVVSNGINRRSSAAPFKLRPLRDDIGYNG